MLLPTILLLYHPYQAQTNLLMFRYSDLPRDARLCMTLYDADGPGRRKAVGGTTYPLFGSKSGTFRKGQVNVAFSHYERHLN